MGAQIPGVFGALQPDVITRVSTRERVNAISGGSRVVCIIGEGETEEVIVQSARGGGADGFNADYSGRNNPDGRHYQIGKLNLVENRTSILKNGVPLRVLEAQIDVNSFDSRYDVRLDSLTGRFELQAAYLEDFGTDALGNALYFEAYAANVGGGKPTVTAASLVDSNAPAEAWTLRCVANIKDGYGDAIGGEAVFTVTGSTSGQLKDTNGNPYLWKSDGVVVSNNVLSFSIGEGTVKFEVGDKFTMRVKSGVLAANSKLVARYIANEDLADPETFFTPNDAFSKHGQPSAVNTLSLGIQMAFENGAPLVTAIQAKPPVPRKTSEFLIAQNNLLTTDTEGATGGFELKDTIFPLELGAVPDIDSKINLFVVEPSGDETQLLLNKEEFYNSTDYATVASLYSNFVMGPTGSAYTVIMAPQVEQNGLDGYATTTSTTELTFTAPSVAFEADRLATGEGDVDKQIVIRSPSSVAGTYTIATVGDGYGDMTVCTVVIDTGSIPGGAGIGVADVIWELADPNDTGAYLAITDDVAVNYLTEGKGLRVSYVNTVDADFFDTNWGESLEAAEKVDVQILVPLPLQTVSSIFQTAKVHVEDMSGPINQKERIVIIGALDGLTPDMLVGTTLAAVEDIGVLEGIQGDDAEEILGSNIEDLADYSVRAAYGDSFRVVYLWPDRIVRNIAGQNTTLPGYFMAPALAGFLGGQTNIAQPPTYKTLAGFTILRDRTARKITKNSLAGAGVLVVEPVSGGGKMLHGLTTVASGAPEEEEISIIGIRDHVARVVRAALRPFVGRLQSPTLIAELNQGLSKLLRSLVSQGLLTGFGDITVSVNPIEPRQIDIGIVIFPRGPVNWIFVDISVSL